MRQNLIKFDFLFLFSSEDILIFLTGQEEIEAATTAARQVVKQIDGQGYPPLKVLPLYAALPTHQQLEAFKLTAPGTRKLIVSTNVAETSVTIAGMHIFLFYFLCYLNFRIKQMTTSIFH